MGPKDNQNSTKICCSCKEPKSLGSFSLLRSAKDGLQPACKVCSNLKNAIWSKNNKTKINETKKKYRQNNPEKVKLWRKNNIKRNFVYYKNNPEKKKIQQLKKYWPELPNNQILETYNNLLKKQKNKCAICEISQESLGKSLAVDHNHQTGKVRGL